MPSSTKTPGFPKTPDIAITVQTDSIGGAQMAFVVSVDARLSDEALAATLDQFYRQVHRQQALASMRFLVAKVEEAKIAIADGPELHQRQLRERAVSRTAMVAAFQAAWQLKGKRADWEASAQERARLNEFDTATEDLKVKQSTELADAKKNLPRLEKEIAKLYHQIHGYDPVETWRPPEELAEAAE